MLPQKSNDFIADGVMKWYHGATCGLFVFLEPKLKVVSSLMTRTEMVLETLVYSPFNHLTQMLASEYFIEFSHREGFKL
jgi:hypothetical protein